jgi:hypothetical protein
VLWFMVLSLLTKSSLLKNFVNIVIYSGDGHRTKKEILDNVKVRNMHILLLILRLTTLFQSKFNISFTLDDSERISFVNIRSRFLLEAKWYPVATMLFQSLGSVFVGLECMWLLSPDIYVDTIGAAFTYPLVRLLSGARVVAYVHYPIISRVSL